MATIGLRDLFYAPITELPDGKEQFGKPVRMAKAIQAQMSTQIAEAISIHAPRVGRDRFHVVL